MLINCVRLKNTLNCLRVCHIITANLNIILIRFICDELIPSGRLCGEILYRPFREKFCLFLNKKIKKQAKVYLLFKINSLFYAGIFCKKKIILLGLLLQCCISSNVV